MLQVNTEKVDAEATFGALSFLVAAERRRRRLQDGERSHHLRSSRNRHGPRCNRSQWGLMGVPCTDIDNRRSVGPGGEAGVTRR